MALAVTTLLRDRVAAAAAVIWLLQVCLLTPARHIQRLLAEVGQAPRWLAQELAQHPLLAVRGVAAAPEVTEHTQQDILEVRAAVQAAAIIKAITPTELQLERLELPAKVALVVMVGATVVLAVLAAVVVLALLAETGAHTAAALDQVTVVMDLLG